MKNSIKHLFMLCLFCMISLGASAYVFSAVNAEGVTLYYNIVSETDLTCEVTNSGNDEIKYSGDIIVPSTVNYKNKTFTVVGAGRGAFAECDDLLSVELPNTLTYLEYGTFMGCIKLKSLKIPQSLESIENSSFYKVNDIESIYITDLNKWAQINFIPAGSCPISGKTKLYLNGQLVTDLTQLSVKEIARWAFSNYQYFESITIPNSVEKIGELAFAQCRNLKHITIPTSVNTIEDGAFSSCGFSTIDIPNSIETITNSAFEGCNLTSIVIPNSIKSIGENAFRNCKLTSVNIPDCVKSLGNGVFNDNPNLRAITVNWDEPITISGGSITSSRDIALIVPAGTKEKYMVADVWKDFFEIVEIDKVAEEIILNKESVVIDLGQEIMLESSILPSDASLQSVGWSSSDPSVATVDKHGNVRGVHKGTATITAKALDGSDISKSCEVIVRRNIGIDEPNGIYTKITTLPSGTQIKLPIYMKTSESVCSFQFDINVPEGFSIAATSGRVATYMIETNAEIFEGLDHALSLQLQSDGSVRVLCSSLTNAIIPNEKELPVLYITLDFDENIAEGDYPILISNISMAGYNGYEAYGLWANGLYESSILVKRFFFTAKSSDLSRGSVVEVSSPYYDAAECSTLAASDVTMSAVSKDGYGFVEWKEAELDYWEINSVREKDVRLSVENPFTFSVNKETHVLAKFTKLADVVEDGVIDNVDLSDCVSLILHPSTENRRRFVAADVYKDEVIDVADYTSISAIILNGGVSAAKSDDFTKYVINMQYDMHMPVGLKMNADDIATALRQTALAKNHSIVTHELENGDVRVLVLSMQNEEIADAKAMLEEIAMPTDKATGEYNITLSNIILAYNDLSKEEVSMMNQKLLLVAPTGIDLTPALSEGEGASYNLNGQKLQKATNGINIIDGKKYIVK